MQDDNIEYFTDLPIVQNSLTRIWRYLTPEKFFKLLDERALFLPNTDLLPDDPKEGSYPDANRIVRDKLWEELEVSEEQRQIIEGHSRWNKHLTFVSCWHLSDHESNALWKIYGKTEKAIVIQSTFGRLRATLPDFVHIHPITYVDYRRDSIPDGHSLYPFFFKSREYIYEQELRAVTGDLPMSDARRLRVKITDKGWSFPIEPNELIETIYVAPGCPQATYDGTKAEARQRSLTAPVLRSAMDAKPRF
jgi:hypothetical protein